LARKRRISNIIRASRVFLLFPLFLFLLSAEFRVGVLLTSAATTLAHHLQQARQDVFERRQNIRNDLFLRWRRTNS
jgi:hypothetical protein